MQRPKIFLDTSALFTAVWSSTGGARMLLKLGESNVVQLLVSSQVLTEIEGVLRRKAPSHLGVLALLLDRSGIHITPPASSVLLSRCEELVPYTPDAHILAAAWNVQVDFFVTLDKKHFLNNAGLATAVSFPIGTPGDCLEWHRFRLTEN